MTMGGAPARDLAVVLSAVLCFSACGADRSATGSSHLPGSGVTEKCVVLLHGKGGGAASSSTLGDIQFLRPGGNDEGWGGRQWRYFPEDRYRQVRTILTSALDAAGCGRVVVQGFSNGGAAAAKLYCRGEDFGGRVKGYIVDDPVPDEGVLGCQPRAGMHVRLYWTGGLAIATDGWSCAPHDWTCEGGRAIGIERYARSLATTAAPSIHRTHTQYDAPPELATWLE